MAKYAMIAAGVVLAALIVLFLAGPRERTDGPLAFSPDDIGADVDAYLYTRERDVPNILRGAQKHVRWADPANRVPTPLSIVYIHGFSASLHEIRPVPDDVAAALGANLFYTRLKGHGRDGAAMAEATALDWREDIAEAFEIGRRIGERVIVVGTSTGGSLAALGLFDDRINDRIAGIVLMSPNFGVQADGSWLTALPYARWLIPALVGRERRFQPENADHARWWTERYPTEAVVPMARVAAAARGLRFEDTDIPALFIFSDADKIVRTDVTRDIAGRWGGPVSVWPVATGTRDDRNSHVLAGDILSPGLNEAVTERFLEWVTERRLQQ